MFYSAVWNHTMFGLDFIYHCVAIHHKHFLKFSPNPKSYHKLYLTFQPTDSQKPLDHENER